jgi:hypothetical protein
VCRLLDNYNNILVLAKIASTDGLDFEFQTASGFSGRMKRELIHRLDFSAGKIAFLSDLEPIRQEHTPILVDLYRPRRDTNLEGGAISLGRRSFKRGITVHSRTLLEYDVAGYNRFKCVVGIEDTVTGFAHAMVRIEADGQEIFQSELTTKDKPKELDLDLKNSAKLRILVDYGDDLDLGDHVGFGDARVVK